MNDMKNKRKSKQAKQPAFKERNAVALNPLLRKAAVHEKSGRAKRTAAKIQLKKTWLERVVAKCVNVLSLATVGQSQVSFEPRLCN